MASHVSSSLPPSQQPASQPPLPNPRRKTVVERLTNAFSKASQRVGLQVRSGLAPQGPLALTIPANLPSLAKQVRKQSKFSRDQSLATISVAAGANTALWSSEVLPVFRAAAASQGAGFFTPSKEDRIVFIDDLFDHVHAGYAKYDVEKFGDSMPALPAEKFVTPVEADENIGVQIVNNFKLFAAYLMIYFHILVFDGHCGQFASTFLQYRFPFELCGNESFANGLYEDALRETYQSIHKELLKAKKYAPEAPNNDFSSGATASVILVTPTRTFFASLGDSPIIVWRRDEPQPDILIKEHDAENKNIHTTLVDSNIFLVLVREVAMEEYYQREGATQNVYYLVTSKGIKQKVLSQAAATADAEHENLNQSQQQPQDIQDTPKSSDGKTISDAQQEAENAKSTPVDEDIPFSDLRIGFSALNVFGTLGDSLYDLEVFNALIDELVAFREDRTARYAAKREQLEVQEKAGVVAETTGVVMGPELEDTLVDDFLLSSNALAAAVSAYSNPVFAAGAGPNGQDLMESVEEKEKLDKKKGKLTLRWKERERDNVVEAEKGTKEERNGGHNLEITAENKNFGGSTTSLGRRLADISNILFPFEVVASMEELEAFDDSEFVYAEFRWWVMARPKWDYLRKHVSLLKKETHLSRVLLAALRNLNATHKLVHHGLLRVPETRSIANKDLAMFVVASDGVIRFYDKFKDEFRSKITKNPEDPEKIVVATPNTKPATPANTNSALNSSTNDLNTEKKPVPFYGAITALTGKNRHHVDKEKTLETSDEDEEVVAVSESVDREESEATLRDEDVSRLESLVDVQPTVVGKLAKIIKIIR
ncbi:hypothetical protein HK096_004170 [Nowakowskiella sp. JEL0078]|nr:hypothetical protein HK096_004170 [Nowakowskiella sp. JEL0078]